MVGSSDITYAAAENHLFEIQSNSSSELLSSVPTLASFSLLIELLDSLGFSRYCLTQVCFSIPFIFKFSIYMEKIAVVPRFLIFQ